jgi:hypothetical protein
MRARQVSGRDRREAGLSLRNPVFLVSLILAISLFALAAASAGDEQPPSVSEPAVFSDTTAPAAPAAPAPLATEEDRELPELARVIEEAVSWLVKNQNSNGSWGSYYTKRNYEIFAMVPGSHNTFRVATSALCVIALEDSPFKTEKSRAAASRGIDFLLNAYNVKRPRGIEHYTVWAFGYTAQCLGEWLLSHPDDERAGKIRAAGRHLVEKLGRYQTLDGGWGYLSLDGIKTYQPSGTSMSFTTASILVGIDRLRRAGVDFPEKMIDRGVRNVSALQTPDGSFAYGDYLKYRPRAPINQIKGSACRTPCCQYAMHLFGKDVPAAARRKGLEDLLVSHIGLQKISVRRPVPHESWYSISGYFYLFGMCYAAYIIDTLPDADRKRFGRALFEAVLHCRQPDGSFWDYPLYSYHKPYGTAFAVIALSRVE